LEKLMHKTRFGAWWKKDFDQSEDDRSEEHERG